MNKSRKDLVKTSRAVVDAARKVVTKANPEGVNQYTGGGGSGHGMSSSGNGRQKDIVQNGRKVGKITQLRQPVSDTSGKQHSWAGKLSTGEMVVGDSQEDVFNQLHAKMTKSLTGTAKAVHLVSDAMAALTKAFNPDQPRDDHGRFGSGGSGGSKNPARYESEADAAERASYSPRDAAVSAYRDAREHGKSHDDAHSKARNAAHDAGGSKDASHHADMAAQQYRQDVGAGRAVTPGAKEPYMSEADQAERDSYSSKKQKAIEAAATIIKTVHAILKAKGQDHHGRFFGNKGMAQVDKNAEADRVYRAVFTPAGEPNVHTIHDPDGNPMGQIAPISGGLHKAVLETKSQGIRVGYGAKPEHALADAKEAFRSAHLNTPGVSADIKKDPKATTVDDPESVDEDEEEFPEPYNTKKSEADSPATDNPEMPLADERKVHKAAVKDFFKPKS